MKGGRDEEKMIGPLFPRLHVNDTEKGGPRAPPRNKMALYEQLSVPSQRFSSGSATMLPLPHNIGSSLVPSMSSSHGGGQERSIFTPFCNPPAPAHLAEKLHSYSFGGVKLTTSMPNHERKSIMPTNFQALNDTGHLSSTAKCNLFQPYNFSNSVNSSMKKHGGGDDFRVPTFPQSEVTPHFSNSLQSMDGDKLPPLSPNSSILLQTTCKKQTKGNNTTDLKSRQHVGNQSEGNPKVSHSVKDPTHWPTSIPSTGDKILADAFLCPSNGDKNPKSFKRAHPSSNQENRNSLVDDISRLHGTNTQSHRECVALRENTPLRDGALVEQKKGIGMGNASMVRGESYSNQSLGHNHRSASRLENGSEYPEGKECGSLQEGDVNRNDGVLDTSMVDSILGLAPDVVVGVIGEKQFWKARRAIVNQQRVFGVQVFELHRLIKVQRLIARSPHILLEDNLYLGKSSIKGSNVKKLPSECVLEAPPLIVKPKDDSQKRNLSTKYAAENITGKLPFSSADNVTNKVPITPRSNYGPYPGKPPPASMATETKLDPWCYQAPPGNQWLVPVMSPSEGLVYKPYSGPCPPAAGFMAPVYGSYGPVSLTPGSGDS
ncbi:hypothetical protein L1049_003842 [Liquidambar formosana]|uniref:ELF3-like protein 2 n=1 Tax=Liquidambar formosana TaxID=63359 RepID=A0AAP0RSU5_LIQFO